jgi:hypothetical protein
MKITKFIHSCLLVEMPAPVNRTALFDPGVMSESALNIDALEFLDDIIITHSHADHMSPPLIKQLVSKFPKVRITAPDEACTQLQTEGIEAVSHVTPGIAFFNAPHEDVRPIFPIPEQLGVQPVTAPWGSLVRAINLALELKPKYVIPVHDWHWSEDARLQSYAILEKTLGQHDIRFIHPETGLPFVVDVKVTD